MAARTKAGAAGSKKQSEAEVFRQAMERQSAAESETVEEIEASTAAPTAAPNKQKVVARSTGKKITGPAQVTYHPGPDDKSWTIFFGMKFEANLPREVVNPELIELARGNPWFSVDGKRAPKHARPMTEDEIERSLDARSGLPGGLDPEKHEVEVEDVIANEG